MLNFIKAKTPYVQRTHWAIKQYFHHLQILQSRKKRGQSENTVCVLKFSNIWSNLLKIFLEVNEVWKVNKIWDMAKEAAFCCWCSYCRMWHTKDSKHKVNVCPNFHDALSGQTPWYCSVHMRVWRKNTFCFALKDKEKVRASDVKAFLSLTPMNDLLLALSSIFRGKEYLKRTRPKY